MWLQQVAFAGLASAGEYQFNVVAASVLADGDQHSVPVYGGATPQPGTLITVRTLMM